MAQPYSNLEMRVSSFQIILRWDKIGLMAKDTPKESPEFEGALKRLEEIVTALEGGELALDGALELFEEGIRLSRFCHEKLEKAERRVEMLMKDASGEMVRVEFKEEDGG